MNDRFEETLQRQTFRQVPASWRREILGAIPVSVSPWWREWLWPSPVAWAAAAAVWVLIALLQLATPLPRGNGVHLSGEAIKERQILMAQMMEARS